MESKKTAIAALRDFSTEDAGRVKGLPLRPGSVIALHCTHNNRYLSMDSNHIQGSPEERPDGIKDWWNHERFTVVDAGHGKIALHNAHHNKFLKSFGSAWAAFGFGFQFVLRAVKTTAFQCVSAS